MQVPRVQDEKERTGDRHQGDQLDRPVKRERTLYDCTLVSSVRGSIRFAVSIYRIRVHHCVTLLLLLRITASHSFSIFCSRGVLQVSRSVRTNDSSRFVQGALKPSRAE